MAESQLPLLSVEEDSLQAGGDGGMSGGLPRRHPLIRREPFVLTHDSAVRTLYENFQQSVRLFRTHPCAPRLLSQGCLDRRLGLPGTPPGAWRGDVALSL